MGINRFSTAGKNNLNTRDLLHRHQEQTIKSDTAICPDSESVSGFGVATNLPVPKIDGIIISTSTSTEDIVKATGLNNNAGFTIE